MFIWEFYFGAFVIIALPVFVYAVLVGVGGGFFLLPKSMFWLFQRLDRPYRSSLLLGLSFIYSAGLIKLWYDAGILMFAGDCLFGVGISLLATGLVEMIKLVKHQ